MGAPLRHQETWFDFAGQLKAAPSDPSDLPPRGFKGFANTTGYQDHHDDIIMPGAYLETLQERAGKIPVLWSHSSYDPLGMPHVLREVMPNAPLDGKTGLWVEATIDETRLGDDILVSMRSRAVQQMSIGFFILQWSVDEEGNAQSMGWPIRLIHKLSLREVSPVVFGANEDGGIYAVAKALGADPSTSLRAAFAKALRLDVEHPLKAHEARKFIQEQGLIKTIHAPTNQAPARAGAQSDARKALIRENVSLLKTLAKSL